MKELEFTGPMVDKFQRALKDANIYAPGGQKIYRELMHRNTFSMDCGNLFHVIPIQFLLALIEV